MVLLPRKLFLALLVIGVLSAIAISAVRSWSVARIEAEMEAAGAVLGPWVASDELRQLADASGLWTIAHPELPQVTAPDWAYDGSAPVLTWTAHEVDRTAETPVIAGDARGVVVTRQPDGALVLDQLTTFLPEARRAHSPEDVQWVAFARYGENEGFWVVEHTGATLATERIDFRVVARDDGRLIGRVTAEGAPPRDVHDTSELFQPSPVHVTREIVALLDDPDPAPAIVLRADELSCPADVMPQILADAPDMPRECVLGATTECVRACTAGDSSACLGAARSMEHGWTLAARRLYRLACIAGSSAGCTRDAELRAAALAEPSADDEACATRVYERACAAGHPPACAHLPAAR